MTRLVRVRMIKSRDLPNHAQTYRKRGVRHAGQRGDRFYAIFHKTYLPSYCMYIVSTLLVLCLA
jgi:hypothetical protein